MFLEKIRSAVYTDWLPQYYRLYTTPEHAQATARLNDVAEVIHEQGCTYTVIVSAGADSIEVEKTITQLSKEKK